MSLSRLADEELVVFLGLARQLVLADSAYSGDERALLHRLAAALGSRWDSAITEAMARIDTRDEALVAADLVTSAGARAIITRELGALSSTDGTHDAEQAFLADLAARWA